jgi:hypothetical protein
LGFASIVPPFAAMLPGNAIRSIKAAQFATGIRTILCSAIHAAIFLPHIAGLGK